LLLENNFISGQNFASLSDIVFCENLQYDEFEKINNEKLKIINKNSDIVLYKLKKFEIKNGDIIFCHISFIKNLFYYLNKLKVVDHITLITGQSDKKIDNKTFQKKPECIKKWYSINVEYENDNLIPIPLGIANNYSKKNIPAKDFISNESKTFKKEEKLYINIRKSTNYKERASLENDYKDLNWVVYKEPNLTTKEYLDDLKKFKFTLCPWGNGIDTHRVWEALYSGSIPVIKYHHTFSSVKNLPIIFLNKYEDLNLELLVKKSKQLNFEQTHELDINYWKNVIHNNKIKFDNKKELVVENLIFEFFFKYSTLIQAYFSNKSKLIAFYLKKVESKLKQ